MPAYGIVKIPIFMNTSTNELNGTGIEIWSQKKICQFLKILTSSVTFSPFPKYNTSLVYDMVAAYGTTRNNEYISLETQETVMYKTKYALRNGLAGVGLEAINQDDFDGVCSNGMFPLLRAIDNARACTIDSLKNNTTTINTNHILESPNLSDKDEKLATN